MSCSIKCRTDHTDVNNVMIGIALERANSITFLGVANDANISGGHVSRIIHQISQGIGIMSKLRTCYPHKLGDISIKVFYCPIYLMAYRFGLIQLRQILINCLFFKTEPL